jgi:RNA polymerase primary sigma factor
VQQAHEAQKLAKQRFARANLRLVVTIARRHDRGRVPLGDLIQEGNLGLMIAVERFDPSRGFRFSTYGTWWIRHTMRRGIAGSASTVQVPLHRQARAQQINRVISRALACTGAEPTAREIAEELGVSERSVQNLRDLPNAVNLPLDRPVGAGDGTTFLDLLVDETSLADEALGDHEWRCTLTALLASLKPIEATILRRRFGLDGYESATHGSVGAEFSLSRERIRQLQESALARLRRSLRVSRS